MVSTMNGPHNEPHGCVNSNQIIFKTACRNPLAGIPTPSQSIHYCFLPFFCSNCQVLCLILYYFDVPPERYLFCPPEQLFAVPALKPKWNRPYLNLSDKQVNLQFLKLPKVEASLLLEGA